MSLKKALISYSHKDEAYRQSLISALSSLMRSEQLVVWSDHEVLPGQHIDDQIMAQLKEADVVFLLISPDFIASDYCYTKELQIALERHENGRSVVVPIVIRPTDWHSAPFAKLMMLPFDAKPVNSWPNMDEAWLSVAQGVRRLLEKAPSEGLEPQVLSTRKINHCLAEAFDQLQARFSDSDGYTACFGFSFDKLDEIVGGVSPGELLIIASRPEHGHVELGHSLVLDSAIKGKQKVLVLSQRLTANQFTIRLLCNLGRVSRFRLSRGEMEDEDWSRVHASIRLLKNSDLTIADSPIRSLSSLRRRFSEIENQQFDLILIDGLEYISSESDERQIALTISDFAKSAGVAISGTLSLGAEMEQRAYRKPLLSDLGAWRVLENFASKILFCHREPGNWIGAADELSEDCTLSLVKSPNGVLGTMEARYFYDYGILNGRIETSPGEPA